MDPIEYPVLQSFDKLGRPHRSYLTPMNTNDDLLGLPRPRRPRHPSEGVGYEYSLSTYYQMLLGGIVSKHSSTKILALTAGLDFPIQGPETDGYAGMVAHYRAVAEGVKGLRPELAEAVSPFADRHGLCDIPWGSGWLYETLPRGRATELTEVIGPVAQVDVPLPRSKPVDKRLDPAADALLLYLLLTGVWSDKEILAILAPVLDTGCRVVNPGTRREDTIHAPTCFCNGWPWALNARAQQAKAKLGITRRLGHPRGQSRWDREEATLALSEFVDGELI